MNITSISLTTLIICLENFLLLYWWESQQPNVEKLLQEAVAVAAKKVDANKVDLVSQVGLDETTLEPNLPNHPDSPIAPADDTEQLWLETGYNHCLTDLTIMLDQLIAVRQAAGHQDEVSSAIPEIVAQLKQVHDTPTMKEGL